MRKTNINIGDVFGNLTITRPHCKKDDKNRSLSECLCTCGNTVLRISYDIKRGNYKSCGCLRGNHKHGHSKRKNWSKSYNTWHGMMRRCYLEKSISYHLYGGRGISVCEQWHDFRNFLADMGEPSHELTLDRIDVNGNYEPENCRWITHKEQGNNRRNNRFITFNNQTLTITQWAEKLKTSRATLSRRLEAGWSIERTLTEPIQTKFSNNKGK